LLVLEGGRVLDRKMGVPAIELVREVAAMRARHGPSAEILVDGAEFDQKAVAKLATEIEPQVVPQRPPTQVVSGDPGTLAAVELTHHLIWDTYDRAAKTQSWMLEQASASRDAAGQQQAPRRPGGRAAEALPDGARRDRLHGARAEADGGRGRGEPSRPHLIEKARAEIAASTIRAPGDWIDDLIDGAAVALGAMCGARTPKGPWNSN
jgi:hypothetical protein